MLALDIVYGLLIGLSLGLTGAGGSILTVPILLYLVGMNIHEATGTSLIIVGIGALAGALRYLPKGLVQWKVAVVFALCGILAAFLGSYLNSITPGSVIMYTFTTIMLIVGLLMIRRSTAATAAADSAEIAGFSDRGAKGWVAFAATALLIGLLTGFLGVGGGFLIVPALVLILKFPMKPAIGTSLLIISLNSIWGIAARLLGLGSIVLGGDMWLIVAGTIIGILIGSLLAVKMRQKALQLGFAYFVIVVALYMGLRTLGLIAF